MGPCFSRGAIMAKRKVTKNKGGRPKSQFNLSDKLMLEILEKYAEGGSDVEVKAMIWVERGSFSDDLWSRWLKEEPLFSGTIKKGRTLSKSWWVENGRVNLKDGGFSYTGWYMQMKNRFGWADRRDVQVKVSNSDKKRLFEDMFTDD